MPVDNNDYRSGFLVTVPGNIGNLVQNGYAFAGSTFNIDGSGTVYTQSQTFAMGSSDVTLYAKWTLSGTSGTYNVGDTVLAGGLIFYDKGNNDGGWRYLEAAPASTEWISKDWGGSGTTVTGADGTAIGTGYQNTIDIVTQFGNAEPYASKTDYAAKLCSDLVSGRYSDWFLPSKDELNLMYTNLKVSGVGGFISYCYWSSSEGSADNAWLQDFYDGSQYNYSKGLGRLVRVVRAF